MGIINSRALLPEDRDGDGATTTTTAVGGGYCPIYDAALVGDWAGLEALCERVSMTVVGDVVDEKEGVIGDDDDDDGGGDDGEKKEEKKRRDECGGGDVGAGEQREEDGGGSMSRMEWIESLEVFDGGRDRARASNEVSCSPRRRRRRPVPLFVDDVGNTALHLACRRDPPLSAVRALASARPAMVWMTTRDGSLPLHLACHCGCDVSVAEELLDLMEGTPPRRVIHRHSGGGRTEGEDREGVVGDDPLLPRDCRGRTPLHLACASSRDPSRRPDLIRLLLLRSADPRGAVLSRDRLGGTDRPRLGLECAIGQLTVITGGLDAPVDDADVGGGGGSGASVGSSGSRRADGEREGAIGAGRRLSFDRPRQPPPVAPVGRTPLNLLEDDYREELDEASLLPPRSIAGAIAACCGERDGGSTNDPDAFAIGTDDDHRRLDAWMIFECWATLSILLLAAGTPGAVEQVKEALGGGVRGGDDDDGTHSRTGSSTFSRPCHDVVRDFQLVYKACQALSEDEEVVCPLHFKKLAKRLVQGQIDSRSLASVSDLKSMWESQLSNSFRAPSCPRADESLGRSRSNGCIHTSASAPSAWLQHRRMENS
jgi:hypothetical protein